MQTLKKKKCSACCRVERLMKAKEERQDLNEVEEKHQKEVKRPFSCSQCGNAFTHLKRHEMIHSGEKLYKCSHCDKRFSQSSSLKTHERIHTGEKPYHCTECGKCFNNSSNLHSHTKNNHSK
uniref:C2H2-type domain-containing protein n=1 Tax=Sinocyclocheilus anshuiensis TaxID=1608454 RepID=A0A671LIJ5_9TELE